VGSVCVGEGGVVGWAYLVPAPGATPTQRHGGLPTCDEGDAPLAARRHAAAQTPRRTGIWAVRLHAAVQPSRSGRVCGGVCVCVGGVGLCLHAAMGTRAGRDSKQKVKSTQTLLKNSRYTQPYGTCLCYKVCVQVQGASNCTHGVKQCMKCFVFVCVCVCVCWAQHAASTHRRLPRSLRKTCGPPHVPPRPWRPSTARDGICGTDAKRVAVGVRANRG
jgi:hypothetical protein